MAGCQTGLRPQPAVNTHTGNYSPLVSSTTAVCGAPLV